jgi:U2 small nuclear ribonucleoprotein A'
MVNSLFSLIVNDNRISKIENLSDIFPNLQNLVLMNNRISDLNEFSKLASNPKLERLYLLNNPVCSKPDYRLFVISRLPQLKVLDFQKVKESERRLAREKFGEFSLPTQIEYLAKLTKKEKIRLIIEKTTSLEEINRLEVLLRSGQLNEELLNKKLMEFKLI